MAPRKPLTKGKPLPAFVKFIDTYGAKALAETLEVTVWAIYGWRKGALGEPGGSRPDPSRMAAIIKASGGTLSAAVIYRKPK